MEKIVIDKDKCIGCFKCKEVCSSIFEVGNDALAKVRYGREYDTKEAETAEICCPTGAIEFVEESSFLENLFNNNNMEDEEEENLEH